MSARGCARVHVCVRGCAHVHTCAHIPTPIPYPPPPHPPTGLPASSRLYPPNNFPPASQKFLPKHQSYPFTTQLHACQVLKSSQCKIHFFTITHRTLIIWTPPFQPLTPLPHRQHLCSSQLQEIILAYGPLHIPHHSLCLAGMPIPTWPAWKTLTHLSSLC